MSWECVSYWIEHNPGLASWVQAAGTILALALTAIIASKEGRKAKRLEKQRHLASVGTVVCILEHVKSTLSNHSAINNDDSKIDALNLDMVRLLAIFDRIDFMTLPSPKLVDAVFNVRKELEVISGKFSDIRGARHHGIYYDIMTKKHAIKLLDDQIRICQLVATEQ